VAITLSQAVDPCRTHLRCIPYTRPAGHTSSSKFRQNHASIPTPYIKATQDRQQEQKEIKSCYFTERDFAVGEKKITTEGKVDRKEKARESRQTSLVGMVVVVTFMRISR
jgi:hypothetical protein